MYSFQLVFDTTPGVKNRLYDPERSSAVYGLRVVPNDGVADYAAMEVSYKRRSVQALGQSGEAARAFRVDSPSYFRSVAMNGQGSPMVEPELVGATNGAEFTVWVGEVPGDGVEGSGETFIPGGGLVPVVDSQTQGSNPLNPATPWAAGANTPPADNDVVSGFPLAGVKGLAIGVFGAAALASNTGKLQCWIQPVGWLVWCRAESFDLAIGETGNGANGANVMFPAAPVPVPGGRICYVPQALSQACYVLYAESK